MRADSCQAHHDRNQQKGAAVQRVREAAESVVCRQVDQAQHLRLARREDRFASTEALKQTVAVRAQAFACLPLNGEHQKAHKTCPHDVKENVPVSRSICLDPAC